MLLHNYVKARTFHWTFLHFFQMRRIKKSIICVLMYRYDINKPLDLDYRLIDVNAPAKMGVRILTPCHASRCQP